MKNIIKAYKVLNNRLQLFGKTKCKYRNKKAKGVTDLCDFYADAGETFYMPRTCCIKECPRLK